jgi:hypothetical protein
VGDRPEHVGSRIIDRMEIRTSIQIRQQLLSFMPTGGGGGEIPQEEITLGYTTGGTADGAVPTEQISLN